MTKTIPMQSSLASPMRRRLVCLLLSSLAVLLPAVRAEAHFPWLTSGPDGHVSLHFGESLDDRTYAMPKAVVDAEVYVGGNAALSMTAVKTDDFVGRRSVKTIEGSTSVSSTIHYGNYHGTDLTYSVQHLAGPLASDVQPLSDVQAQNKTATKLKLKSQIIDTPTGVTCTIFLNDKPLEDAEVKLFCAEGHEEASTKTDKTGRVQFNDKEVQPGLNGIVVGYVIAAQGDETPSQTLYLTATFFDPEEPVANDSSEPTADKSVAMPAPVGSVDIDDSMYPKIPQQVTSFGAAICADNLYMYGGHTGQAHQYDDESQGHTLWQIPVKGSGEWKSVATGPRLQGLAMVADGGKLYRIGGFTARNIPGDEHDLWSQADVASFNPETKQWSDLPPLPEPRSSFDAAVMDGNIYVAGGWTMAGEADPNWLKTAYRIDLSAAQPKWKPLSNTPFKRRAVSLAAFEGKIYVIGGMQEEGTPSKRIDIYDPKSDSWTTGPEVLGESMDGFGSSSFATGGRLYTTTYSGLLQRLTKDGSGWELVAELPTDRFFHRLLPIDNDHLLTIGGASMSSGKFEKVEVITLK